MKKNKTLKQLTEIDYSSKLSKDDKEYLQKFDDEMYGGNSGRADDSLMTVAEHIKEDNRTHNHIYRDAFCVALNTNSLNYGESGNETIMRANDELQWEDVFKQLGPDKALDLIINQAIRDIDAQMDTKTVIVRTLSKYERLKTNLRKEKGR